MLNEMQEKSFGDKASECLHGGMVWATFHCVLNAVSGMDNGGRKAFLQ